MGKAATRKASAFVLCHVFLDQVGVQYTRQDTSKYGHKIASFTAIFFFEIWQSVLSAISRMGLVSSCRLVSREEERRKSKFSPN